MLVDHLHDHFDDSHYDELGERGLAENSAERDEDGDGSEVRIDEP